MINESLIKWFLFNSPDSAPAAGTPLHQTISKPSSEIASKAHSEMCEMSKIKIKKYPKSIYFVDQSPTFMIDFYSANFLFFIFNRRRKTNESYSIYVNMMNERKHISRPIDKEKTEINSPHSIQD